MDFNQIAEKWRKKWEEEKLFEANPDKRKKFFINFPYPYINSYLHLGHAFSVTRVDVMARYKRMQGYNVLFPQGWHCTGTPVFAAAQRVKEKEPKQIKILEQLGFDEKEIGKFCDVKHWIDVFVPAAKEDLSKLGASIDWRRSFITTDLNPRYDKFIRWQFRKLREKGYVDKGKHPVVWCEKDKMPVGDHDRVEGEGETPQEFSLLKFRHGDCFLVAATLRPETVFGQANLWINPNALYEKIEVNGEKWIVGKEAAIKLENQDRNVKRIKTILGSNLVGKHVRAPMISKDIIILPADFVDEGVGTGIVTSVPSDAPYDYAALRDLQQNENLMKKYSLDVHEIRKIKPVPIIISKELGDLPAVKIVEQLKIKDQNDPLLEEATATVYKAGFYSGRMNDNCGKYHGMTVDVAKEQIKRELEEKGELEKFYELSSKVVCRCLTPCIVKIVSDQWFLKYGNLQWKEKTREALSQMRLYPELSRAQFEYVIGWLNDWACTHHHGTGTKLPWDEHWVIESLSDSTIYMAFYTISHLLAKIPEDEINDELFDYVFLGIGSGSKSLESLRQEFEYWYPFDVRSSGKDLIQNHLSFCLFNHSAIFPEKYWPRAYSVNGWLLVDGEKMSKSKGNFFTIREIISKYTADVARTSLMLGGEGMSDPNFDMNNAKALLEKLEQWHLFAKENYKESKEKELEISERIFLSAINRSLKEGTAAMDSMLFRTAFENLFFQMQKALKEYLKRKEINQHVLSSFIEMQTKAISPFAPFICEEIWQDIGKKEFISTSKWPKFDESKIDEKAEAIAEFSDNTRKDIHEIMRLTKIEKPFRITLFVSEEWKYKLFSKIKEMLPQTRNTGEILKKIMATELKRHGQDISKIIPKLVHEPGKIPNVVLSQKSEIEALSNSKKDYEAEFGCKVEIMAAENSKEQKARQTMPGKAAILIE